MENRAGNDRVFSVITSFSRQGYEDYGRDFIRTFKTFWPASVRLLCYWEGECPDEVSEGWNLELLEPCKSFLERHRDNPIVQGKSQSHLSPWGPKARAYGYSYRNDAYKFARKVFAVAHAAREIEIGKLFWIDADVITRSSVPEGLLEVLLPDKTSLCYLARRETHSELGFVGYNLNRPETHDFIKTYEETFAEDRFFNYRYWTDCHVFDALIQTLHPRHIAIPHTNRGHPFDYSILGSYMTHLKGPRKHVAIV